MTAPGPCVLAIDVGTSGPKAAIVSLQGGLLATARAHVETIFLPDDGAEQDADALWNAVKQACGSALRASGVAASDVLAVICSSQYSSIVPVDARGRPTMNMVLWLDKRGSRERLRRIAGYPRRTDSPWQMLRWLRVHGLPPVDGGMSLTHMRWIRHARPDAYARTASFLEPMDYVTMRFTGRATANQCTAFMSLMTDNRRLNVTGYDAALLAQSGIDADKLPPLVPLDSIVGTVLPDVAAELGLSPGTRVVTGINDTQCGGMATAAFSGSHAALSIGSTSVMITHVGFKRTDVRHVILSMPSPVPGTYFVMAENGMGGGTAEHFLRNLVYASDQFGELTADNRYSLLQRAVDDTPPGSAGVLFLPWMGGSLAPAADARMRGGFLNLSLHTTRSHMARAVLEGVAMNLRWMRGPVEKFARRRFSHFVFYGGGAESDAWSQILADVLETPVHQMANPQYATCVGAGLLAFQRLGQLGFEDFASRVPIRRRYEPNAANRQVYDDMSGQLVNAFRRTRPIFRALNASGAAR
ncbi:MAG TPA: FGGY-family carbohydrate kinase [Steroidobacteraceae bacterium]